MRGDSAARSQFYEKLVFCGIMTPDDCRALEEMNPLPDGLGSHPLATKNLDTLAHIIEGETTGM